MLLLLSILAFWYVTSESETNCQIRLDTIHELLDSFIDRAKYCESILYEYGNEKYYREGHVLWFILWTIIICQCCCSSKKYELGQHQAHLNQGTEYTLKMKDREYSKFIEKRLVKQAAKDRST